MKTIEITEREEFLLKDLLFYELQSFTLDEEENERESFIE